MRDSRNIKCTHNYSPRLRGGFSEQVGGSMKSKLGILLTRNMRSYIYLVKVARTTSAQISSADKALLELTAADCFV